MVYYNYASTGVGAALVRVATHRGRPLGGESFMSKLERLVGRRLRSLPVGRPRKKKGQSGPHDE